MSSKTNGAAAAPIKAFLTGPLALVVDEPDTGPFATEACFLRTLEACSTLEVVAHKLASECQQRVLSYASRDFADSTASSVQRAQDALPLVRTWASRLRTRLDKRGKLPLAECGLKPRFVRVCDVYELSDTERKVLGALLMYRASHAFASVKLGSSLGYGGLGGGGGGGAKSGITLCSIIDVSLTDISALVKPERKYVKQGVLTPGVQLLSELPSLQLEAVLLLLALPLNEAQLFNIEKTDLMKVLREEPGFDESKLAPKKRAARDAPAQVALDSRTNGANGGPTSLYSLLQMEVAAEASASGGLLSNGGGDAAVGGGDGGGGTGGDGGDAAMEEGKEGGAAGSSEAAADSTGASPASKGGRATRSGRAKSGAGGKAARGAADVAEDEKPAAKAAKLADGKAGGKAKATAGEGEGGPDAAAAAAGGAGEEEAEELPKPRTGPYDSDLEYLQDMFQLAKLRADIARTRRHMEERGQQMANTKSAGGGEGEGSGEDDDEMPNIPMEEGYWGIDEYSYEMEALSRGRFGRNMRHEHSKQARHEVKRARKLQARADRLNERIQMRLQQMTDASMRLPRLERLASALGLCDFEKNVVVSMIGQAIAPRSIGLMGGGGGGMGGGGASPSKTMQVEVLLRAFSHSLQAQIEHRKHFYKSAVLVREGILVLHGDELGADLTQTLAEIDRRMLDFVVGLDTEFSELMDGSHLYTPQVAIEEVVLPDVKKDLVLDTVKHFDTFTQASRNLELNKKLAYGRGLVLLFYGPSGTGKTMMANALAALIGKKVLMINFPALGANSAGAILKLVFREAKIHDAIIFFDECESIFMDRTKGNLQVRTHATHPPSSVRPPSSVHSPWPARISPRPTYPVLATSSYLLSPPLASSSPSRSTPCSLSLSATKGCASSPPTGQWTSTRRCTGASRLPSSSTSPTCCCASASGDRWRHRSCRSQATSTS